MKFIYGPADPNTGIPLLSEVDSYAAAGQQIDSVTYTYGTKDPGNGISLRVLTGVGYSDGTSATYTYGPDNDSNDPAFPLLATADDVRYNGPMRHIAYQYWSGGNQTVRHGTVSSENNLNAAAVSSISRPNPPGGTVTCAQCVVSSTPVTRTETRGDSPTRTFTYTAPPPNCRDPETGQPCDTCFPINNPQFLTQYTDFKNQTTYLGYDPSTWFITSVKDANGNTTNYSRGPAVQNGGTGGGIGQILQIKHPDGTTINYTYQDSTYSDPHYVAKVTDERSHSTIYTRDPNNHLRITQINYPDGGFETFAYNGFGQVVTHQMTNTAYESFVYDTQNRGLLTDKYNPFGSPPGGNDPHTHYDYYTSGPWTDRVLKITLPANHQGLSASETYEYDLDANLSQVPGRGLVTKITHADGYYKSFSYDPYGNKTWEEDELRNRTTFGYDAYNRRTSVAEPGQPSTTYDYSPTQGGNSYLHTTTSAYFVTDPMHIVTANGYDQNFRKTSTTQGYNGSLPATTWFHYDPVGNQDYVTDPRGQQTRDPSYTTFTSYDARNRKIMIQAPLNQTTQFVYTDNINVTQIIRPDGHSEYKSYDTMNRMTTDTVPKDNGVSLLTTFRYNVSGTLHWVEDPNGNTTYFIYNAANLKTDMQYPDIATKPLDYQHWTWDNAYNLQTRRTANTTVQSFAYDIRNRPVEMRWSLNTVADYWSDFDYWPDSPLVSRLKCQLHSDSLL